MATNKVGALIKEARAGADMTQEQLARKIAGLSAEDISLAERGKKELTQAQLKQIAKITGVTQASLVNAAKETAAKSTTAKKTTAKKTTTKKSTTKKSTTSTASKSSMQVTATEKKLVELYRQADAELKKNVMKLLKGGESDSDSLIEGVLELVQDILESK